MGSLAASLKNDSICSIPAATLKLKSNLFSMTTKRLLSSILLGN